MWALWETAFCAVFKISVGAILASRGMTASMPLRCCLALERGRTDLAERPMTTSLVIEHLDVVEQGHLRVAVARKPVGLLLLHGRRHTSAMSSERERRDREDRNGRRDSV
jgi:hypothetical protein